MFSSRTAFQRFADIVSSPEAQIRVAEAALVIASEFRRGVSVGDYLRWLDRTAADSPPSLTIEEAGERFTNSLGFRGSEEDYYDPKNSLLDQVIDRRTGIPIALCIVLLDMFGPKLTGMEGIGFPGHFMVRDSRSGKYLDPYHGSETLSEGEARDRVQRLLDKEKLPAGRIRATAPRQILFRLLTNLKLVLLDRQEYGQAAAVQEKLLVLAPGRPQEYRDLGVVAASAGDWGMARRFLGEYLEMKPDAPDAQLVRVQLQNLVDQIARRN
jgi:regulator of sirC expression with transglutaminase-like and TPR domain